MLVVLAGPVAAALVHCAVKLVRTENLVLADAWEGYASTGGSGSGSGRRARRSCARRVRSPLLPASLWPLAFLTLYLLVLLGIYQLVLWTLAIAEPGGLSAPCARRRRRVRGSRPGATLALGLALLLVNVAGLAAAVMPFLTLTVAYTFLATARFAARRPGGGCLMARSRSSTSRSGSTTPSRSTISASTSRTASSWFSSAPPAAARRPRSGCSPGWRTSRRGGS